MSSSRAQRFALGCAGLLARSAAPTERELSTLVELAERMAQAARAGQAPAALLSEAAVRLECPPLRSVEAPPPPPPGPVWLRHPGPVSLVEDLARLWRAEPAGDPRLRALGLAYRAEFVGTPYLCLERADLAPDSPGALCLALAARLREAVYALDGELCERATGDRGSGCYRGPSGAELIVEWHELLVAEEAWASA